MPQLFEAQSSIDVRSVPASNEPHINACTQTPVQLIALSG
jgi:hypothetical protein